MLNHSQFHFYYLLLQSDIINTS